MNERRLSALDPAAEAEMMGEGGWERLSGMEGSPAGDCGCDWGKNGKEVGGCSSVVVVGLDLPLSATE
jgi:hypothetical protein